MTAVHVAAWLLFGAAFIYLEVLLAWSSVSESGVAILDLQPYWTVEIAKRTLGELGQSRVKDYMQIEQSLDLVFPIIYACLFAVSIDATAPHGASRFRRFALVLPSIAAAADFFENTAIIALCRQHLGGDVAMPTHVFVAGHIATPLKWCSIVASVLVIVVSVIRGCCKRTGKAREHEQ